MFRNNDKLPSGDVEAPAGLPLALTPASWIPYRLWPLANYAHEHGHWNLLDDCEDTSPDRAGSTSSAVPNVVHGSWTRSVGPVMAERQRAKVHYLKTAAIEGTDAVWLLCGRWV
jgi:hypothetical protein